MWRYQPEKLKTERFKSSHFCRVGQGVARVERDDRCSPEALQYFSIIKSYIYEFDKIKTKRM